MSLHLLEMNKKFNLQIIDLRRELECRTLSSKGLKSQLIARLTKQLKTEQEVEEENVATKVEEEKVSAVLHIVQLFIYKLQSALGSICVYIANIFIPKRKVDGSENNV